MVSLSEWPNLGTHLQLRLTANVTPTNNVQVAFGTDVNRNADLEPEETDFVAGIDCGVAFVRDERSDLPPSASFLNLGSCTFDLTSAYRSYAPNLAKVTTRGLPEANATIKAKVFNTGLMIIVR